MKILAFSFLLIVFVAGCFPEEEKSELQLIDAAFHQWKEEAVRKGKFLGIDSCNPEYIGLHGLRPRYLAARGIPDTGISYLYADINKDGRMDGLALFHTKLCHATTPHTISQSQLLILSGKKGYSANDSFFASIKLDTIKYRAGDIHILGMSSERFFGICEIQVNKNSPQDERVFSHSRKLPIAITWPGKELILLDDEPSNSNVRTGN
jgi:hypothetical protein